MGIPQIMRETVKRKTGQAGLLLIAFYIFLAFLAPYITSHDPIRDLNLASNLAMPEWVAVFPGYSDLPRNAVYNFNASNCSIEGYRDELYEVLFKKASSAVSILIYYKGNTSIETQGPKILAIVRCSFNYDYRPPNMFVLTVQFNYSFADPMNRYKLSIILSTGLKEYTLYDTGYLSRDSLSRWQNPLLISSNSPQIKELNNIPLRENTAQIMLSSKGLYSVELRIMSMPLNGTSTSPLQSSTKISQEARVDLGRIILTVPGLLYGILGTNHVGADVWSQFVWGARQSILVGLIASSVSVALGIVFGILLGYAGRYSRELLVFLVDTIYLIPLLPILLITLVVVGRNIYITSIIIGMFLWAGLARELGNWILSLKERPYVEAAQALGASKLYILLRHVIPFTVHLLLFGFIIRIPFSILLEAGLSILGFGDPFQPSWGKMISEALAGGALISGAWWWIIPPVLGLSTLSLGFVYLGYVLDDILNPRLREQKS
jgi:ABC-type dipeptide/oligopeptide/nickel transport system permease subunit